MRNPVLKTTRKVLTLTALAVMVTGGAFLSGGTASAATTLADACDGSVSGNMGDKVAVQGAAVSDIVKKAAQSKEILLHFNGVDPDALAKAITAKGALNVGQIPTAVGGSIGGDVVASAVTQALQGNGALGESAFGTRAATLQAIKDGVTKSCGLTTLAINYTTPPSAPSTDPSSGGGPSSGLPTLSPGSTGGLTVPLRDYGNIPVAGQPGFALPPGANYPSNTPLPGQAPEYGLPGANAGQGADIRNAGNADALSAPDSPSAVQLPMLLAVVALAGVTAALVRTWVLRRVS